MKFMTYMEALTSGKYFKRNNYPEWLPPYNKDGLTITKRNREAKDWVIWELKGEPKNRWGLVDSFDTNETLDDLRRIFDVE